MSHLNYRNLYEYINSFLDFEYEDQPEQLEDYTNTASYLWNSAKFLGIESEIEVALRQLIEQEDPTLDLNSYFLSAKHDPHDILRLLLKHKPAN